MQSHLKSLLNGQSLDREAARDMLVQIISGQVPAEQIGAILIALQLKGESVEELAGMVEAMRSFARPLTLPYDNLLDTCGTGGDNAGTFNISTTVAFVTAAAGQKVAKHGNRSVSSLCGSADVLECLGLRTQTSEPEICQNLDEFGLTFLFAPAFHPALKNLATLRRNLGVRTAFNLLGPLLNPARVRRQLIGVFHENYLRPMAEVARELGAEETMIVRGHDGLDEITLTGPTEIAHLRHDQLKIFSVHPEEFGLRCCDSKALLGGDPMTNARILNAILMGEPGAKREVVLFNSAAALMVGGHATDFKQGLEQARTAIDSGQALLLLRRMQQAHAGQVA